ncbi:MAG: phenylalanine--tRNA ligase subunit alpha [Bacteroidales bacterium]|jgi:phenylalanyl-tRNA synthetase alpha chain|nr:phenylalanine--tRNA ligase subunit alpha [Lentimicrobiaceae bacterium]MDG1136416.1 phenylalanine--tRNA ligase subunit alpha [Bacteroidales bacterium]MDG1902422.1 phenylalanine--tRNA ligase subunit alpha [Bacteroidales bacterium]MDG2081874.1 phenylalanine--tRNA ligase subunit alpha [Bacteroidales bacterium]|tara:strand:- start:6534 stop:7550 length:1017 start_codon:yes stop_codon:yes gene_type:complete
MKDKIAGILEDVKMFSAENIDQLEEFRIKYLSKKGIVTGLFAEFKNVAPDRRKEMGQLMNGLKNAVQDKILSLKEGLDKTQDIIKKPDLTLPAEAPLGSRHPLSIVRNEIIDIFSRIGFNVSEGPEIEDDFHNFSALNFPADHPARDMQDTFFINKNPDIALRTHTSSVQVRVMENSQPPIRTISPGRVFRNEAISARAHCIFHQVEGLYVDTNVSFADLKQTLFYFAKELFGEDTNTRFRPSYFPFTEPSAEMDISCNICGGNGCNICKYSGWVEILGCGMVDPNVLDLCGIDSEKYTGFAFGMGVERITMLKYQINDLRLFFENDVRFINQFKSTI